MFRLFQFDSCPYCAKVRRAIQDLGLQEGKDFAYVEASRGTPGREEVIKLGGLSQVPFLVDGNVQMYESQDIIGYLKEKYST
ncbi:glutaredoxin-like protein [Leptospira ryugenii]|uniref:Glutaredoxin-like protein n=1 Tax=Leptospira ryugenii TaxID=1917863 RepID=A0A2P2DWE2_9LEPT|nr:glutathione S-transferase N-terminal domain-containing protein [Leptospira ryugenii]GBF48936.1 glutaredoxin-like protein [Leptospira ryugenii]